MLPNDLSSKPQLRFLLTSIWRHRLFVNFRIFVITCWVVLKIKFIDLQLYIYRMGRFKPFLRRQIRKYSYIALISWQNSLVYRLNFIMWRVRMVIQTLSLYFLWLAVTANQAGIFSYTQSEILTYSLLTSVIVAFVFSSRSIDAQTEISTGSLNNYLIKPLNYFLNWLSRDFADKWLNFLFSISELVLIFLFLKPPLVIPHQLSTWLAFISSIIFAMTLYFILSLLVSMTTFWYYQHNGWAQRFLVFVLLQTLGGGLFPLDMLPKPIVSLLNFLPTTYFVYFPLQIYLQRISPTHIITGLTLQLIWIYVFYRLATHLWKKGLTIYGAYGR